MSRPPVEANLQLPDITQPLMAPAALTALIDEFAEQNRQGNHDEAIARLRDIAGFSARYFAGVAQAAARELGCLSAEEGARWSQNATVAQARDLLALCLSKLKGRPERLARKFYAIFYDQDLARPFARALAIIVESPEEHPENAPLIIFCEPDDRKPDPEFVLEMARAIDGWMMATFSFFLECEQRFESGNFFGQLEHAVQFEQYLLRTGLSVRVRESRNPSLQLTLAPEQPPEEPPPEPAPVRTPSGRLSMLTGVKLPSFSSGKLRKSKALELLPVKAEVDVSEAPTIVASLAELMAQTTASTVETPKKVLALGAQPAALVTPAPVNPSVPAESIQPLAQLLDKMLQAPAPAPKPSLQELPRPRVEVQIDHLGYIKNAQGKLGYGGHLWIRNVGEGELAGTVISHNESIQVAPSSIVGNETRCLFWVNPNLSGASGSHIQIKTEHEERLVPTWRLMPRSQFAGLTAARLAGLLLAPGLLGSLYCVIVLFFTGRWVEATLHSMLGGNYERYMAPGNPLSLRGSGVGELDLQIIPRAQTSLLLFFLLSWLVPTIVCKLYQHYPRHAQVQLSTLFTFSLVFPSALFGALYYSPLCTGTLYLHPELSFIDFRQHLVEFVGLNFIAASYYFLEVAGLWKNYLNQLGQFVLSLLLLLLYLGTLFYLIYGSAWFHS
jgi:hypothetical protein